MKDFIELDLIDLKKLNCERGKKVKINNLNFFHRDDV